jgi:SAM-dependent methyltransferase
MRKHKIYKLSLLLIVASLLVVAHGQQPQAEKKLDVPYVPTPQTVVDAMLSLAAVKKDDVVYDLGCGDGRIVITAAKKYGARGVGIDIDPERIKEANANAKLAGVNDRVKFVEQDLFKTDFNEASVVTLYLLPDINLRLRPKLLSELKPGTRVVSHAFDMGDWKPDKTETVDGDRRVFFWIIPEKKTARK